MQFYRSLVFSVLFLIQSIAYSQGNCCCGGNGTQLDFPDFDFEIPPFPKPGLDTTYCNGSNMGAWLVTKYCVDIIDPDQYNVGWGNPNGHSHCVDLWGGGGPGSILYILTGLKVGYLYTIEWYYAKFYIEPANIVGNVKIAGGAWLNVTWTATNAGNIIWLKKSYNFVAQTTTASLEFSDAGSTSPWPSGMLIDDIKIYEECGNADTEKPVVNNPPQNVSVECDKDIPPLPKLDVMDNCDTSPAITLKLSTKIVDPCTKIITRNWEVKDQCGNFTLVNQDITVSDQKEPVVTNPPIDLKVECDKDVPAPPKLIATDNCDSNPKITMTEKTIVIDPCTKKITRHWNINDACGNSTTVDQIIDVADNKPPNVKFPPIDYQVSCDAEIPDIPILIATDNCDPNPKITFVETRDIIDPCHKVITRNWEIADACGNKTTQQQVIDVNNKIPPQFKTAPKDLSVTCDVDVFKKFVDWIGLNGSAIVTDSCVEIFWQANYDHVPKKHCDTIAVEFIAINNCGLQSSRVANFIVMDTVAPKFLIVAQNKSYACVSNTRDSLRAWLSSYGNSTTTTDCDTVILSSNFNGDSSLNPLKLTFFAKDRCGNSDSCSATFTYRNPNDTLRFDRYSCTISKNTIDTLSYFVNGCDSIVIVNTIKLYTDSSYISLNTCNPLQAPFDTLHLINHSGCDSMIIRAYFYRPPAITNIQKMDCSYKLQFKDTLQLKGQYCDSLVITEYIPLRKDSNSVIKNTCDTSQVGKTILHLINSLGCDSVVTVSTIYTGRQISYATRKTCGLLKSFIDTATFANGICDSIVITTHTLLPLDTTNIQGTTCDVSKAGTYSKNLLNQFGCDSLVIQNIQWSPSDSVFISNTTCTLSQSGIKRQKLINHMGCDSIVQTTTVFVPSDTSLITQFSCNFADVRLDTLVYHRSTCDSIVFRTIVFVQADTNRLSKNTCDPFATGIDTMVIQSNPCNTVVITNTQFVPADTTQFTKISCNPKDAGLNTEVLKNSRGCDSLILTNTNFVPLKLELNLDSITCYNRNDGILKIVNASNFSAPFVLNLNNIDLGNLNQINNLGPGFYTIFIRDQKGCLTDSVQFNFSNPPELIIDLGNNFDVKKGTIIDLNLQSNRNLQTIFWEPSSLTNCSNCRSIEFTVNQDMWLYVQATDDRNCTQNDSVYIRLSKSSSVYAPNSFSPNGDNINDYFYIQGNVNAVIELLFIYDRWGNKIFEADNISVNMPTSGWDGTFRSEKMIPGVYVYYAKVKIDNEEIELKGDLTLIR